MPSKFPMLASPELEPRATSSGGVPVNYVFQAGTVIDPDQVNDNFAQLDKALNRTGGTATGPLDSQGGSLTGSWGGNPVFTGQPNFAGGMTGSVAGLTPAGSDKQIQFNDAGAFRGDGGLLYDKATGGLIVGQSLRVGTNPATAGYVRMPNSAGIQARNAANSANITGLHFGLDNVVYVGSGDGNDAGLVLRSSVGGVKVPTTVAIGTNPSPAAHIGLPSDGTVYYRDAGNTSDYNFLTISGGQPLLGHVGVPIVVNSGQLQFPASQIVSANANTLDDYREGTWTPFLTAPGGASGQAYASRDGTFIKIGRLVTVWGSFALTNAGTLVSAPIEIGGLPFATATYGAVTASYYLGLVGNIASLTGQTNPYSNDGATRASLFFIAAGGNNGTAQVGPSMISNSFQITFTATYLATS